jgi:hypothetical protein
VSYAQPGKSNPGFAYDNLHSRSYTIVDGVGYFMGTHPYHFKNLRFSCIYKNITPYRAPGMDPRAKFTLEEHA